MSRSPRNLRLGRYLLQERLAQGGMGEVYRAAAYGAAGVVKTVCVKRIRAEKADKTWRVESFIEEARLSMQLSHANVVSVFDFGVAEGGYYLAMEWVDGVDLMAFVRRGNDVQTSLVAYVGAETCRALAYAHMRRIDGVQGIIHRDVKPSNILLSCSGEVKLADFGIATIEGGQRSVAGTPGYMSPEQACGAVVDARADIYGLGVSLLEFAIGRRAEDVAASLVLVEDDALRELLSRMLEGELAARAADAHMLGQEFERMVGMALARGEDHPRNLLSASIEALSRLKVSAAVGRELSGTASLLLDPAELGLSRASGTELATDMEASLAPESSPSALPTVTELPYLPQTRLSRPVRRTRTFVGRLLGVGLLVASAFVMVAYASSYGVGNDESGAVREFVAGAHEAPAEALLPREEEVFAQGPAALPTEVEAPEVAPLEPPEAELEKTPKRAPRLRRGRPPAPAETAPHEAAQEVAVSANEKSEKGGLNVSVRPWGLVYIDGEPRGHSPILGLELSAGEHEVRVENPELGVVRAARVRVPAGRTHTYRVDLR